MKANAASPAAVTSSVPASSHSASRRANRSGITYITKAAASGGTGEELIAVATAPAITTSASTVRGQHRRKAAGITATATIATAAHSGIPRRNATAFNSRYTSTSSAVNARSIAIQCTGRSRLGGGASGSMPRQYPRRSRFRVVPQTDADCCT